MSEVPTPGNGAAAELPAGLVREALAPDRLVILWASRLAEAVLAAVQDAEEMLLVVPPEETLALVDHSGAPSLLLIDPGVLDDAALEVLATLRRRHPEARMAMVADHTASSAGLVAAMREGVSVVIDPGDPVAVLDAITGAQGGRARIERVLAVGAHPDDVEIGCGATLLRHRAAGHPVTVLTLSRGAVGGAREERRKEAVACAMMLGAELIMGDLPDTRMSEAPEAISLIEAVIAAVRPTTVYVHSKWDNHQDHRTVHDATMVAARLVEQVYCYQSPSSRNGFDPTRFVPVGDTVHEKVRLLAHYRSQSTRHYLEPELVVASARYWARQLPTTRYAEPFEVVRASQGDGMSAY